MTTILREKKMKLYMNDRKCCQLWIPKTKKRICR